MDFILNPLPVSPKRNDSSLTSNIVSKNVHFFEKPGLKSDGNLSFTDYNLATRVFHTHKATTLHATLAMLLSELMEVMLGQLYSVCSKHRCKRWERYMKTRLEPVDAFVRTFDTKVAALISENNALHNA